MTITGFLFSVYWPVRISCELCARQTFFSNLNRTFNAEWTNHHVTIYHTASAISANRCQNSSQPAPHLLRNQCAKQMITESATQPTLIFSMPTSQSTSPRRMFVVGNSGRGNNSFNDANQWKGIDNSVDLQVIGDPGSEGR